MHLSGTESDSRNRWIYWKQTTQYPVQIDEALEKEIDRLLAEIESDMFSA